MNTPRRWQAVPPRPPEDAWIPVRYILHDETCSNCGFRIARASPGASKGTRGTKAWWNKAANVWECLECRSEAVRALKARHEEPGN